MKTLKSILLYGLIAFSFACEPEDEPGELITLEVFGVTVTCTSNNKGSCYIVRQANSEEPFQIMPEDIEGFELEPRYRHLISVRKTLLPKEVPSQPDKYSYKLHEILSKEVEEGLDLEGVWKAIQITNPDKPENWEKYETVIQIAILRRIVIGKISCNQGYSFIDHIKGNELRMKTIVTTMLPCYDHDEIKYDNFAWGEIFKTKTYKVTGTKLELFDESGALLVEFEKVQP